MILTRRRRALTNGHFVVVALAVSALADRRLERLPLGHIRFIGDVAYCSIAGARANA